ncbi:MAG: DNA repair protein RecO [Pyrinomonadaceae bacterium]
MAEIYKGLHETEAITLRTYKLGDADKIAVLLTKQNGLVRGVARGARRLKSRYGASLEPCTHTSVTFQEKEGRELVKLGHAEIIRSYFDLSCDPKHAAILEYMCDVLIHFAPPHEPNEKLFRMTKACLDAAADAPEDLSRIARYFEIWTLRLGGFLADWRRCTRCGSNLKGNAHASEDGRLSCTHCGSGVVLSAKTLEHLHSLQRLTPQEWAQSARCAGADVERELAQYAGRAIMYVLERSPARA